MRLFEDITYLNPKIDYRTRSKALSTDVPKIQGEAHASMISTPAALATMQYLEVWKNTSDMSTTKYTNHMKSYLWVESACVDITETSRTKEPKPLLWNLLNPQVSRYSSSAAYSRDRASLWKWKSNFQLGQHLKEHEKFGWDCSFYTRLFLQLQTRKQQTTETRLTGHLALSNQKHQVFADCSSNCSNFQKQLGFLDPKVVNSASSYRFSRFRAHSRMVMVLQWSEV